jgi:choline dehydrogenase-like flavoprotein
MKRIETEVLVVGSGPGGSITAAMLAEAGQDVLIAEEGRHLHVDSSPDHSLAQMEEKWRSGGLTAALGNPKVTYIEGRCVGGASESNAGLYHPPIAQVLEDWKTQFKFEDFGADLLAPHLENVVNTLGVSRRPNGYSPASDRLVEGAEKLGWEWAEIERFWRYETTDDGREVGHRRSMSETLIPRAVNAGARLMSQTRVVRIERRGRRAVAAIGHQIDADGQLQTVRIEMKRLIVCAGAIQTPLLLRNSGWGGVVGNGLTLNPMVRIVARFPEPVNRPSFGVPVVQIEEFKPAMTLGCSYSAPPHLAMWLEGSPAKVRKSLEDWERMAVFYVKVCGQGRGSIRQMPILGDALVRYRTHSDDFVAMSEGLARLATALFAAGAEEVHSPLPGVEPLRQASQADSLRGVLNPRNSSLSAIHLHSSVRMGEDTDQCGADSHGRLYGAENVWVNDSSLLPTSPGVNPQGTILAIARRNTLRWLGV